MSFDLHPAIEFVYEFHRDLTCWFAGTGDSAAVLQRLGASLHPEMALVYPSGRRLLGAELVRTIADFNGSSPGFVASISDAELIRGDEDHAVVAYVETQTGARNSASENRRSALALIVRYQDRWCCRFIQETGLD